MAHCGKIMTEIQNYGFQLTRVLMLKFDDDMVRAFFDPRGQKKDFLELSSLMTSDNSLAIEVTGENAI
jgi:nucleoside diphosphate kinase